MIVRKLALKFELVCRTPRKNLKRCDLISDTGMISNQQPSITTGLRGLSYVELKLQVQTATCSDCTEAPLPINQCVGKMIASLHDENNHITIPVSMIM
jgi:hypothetical protein